MTVHTTITACSLASVLQKTKAPVAIAVSSAIKADLKTLAKKHIRGETLSMNGNVARANDHLTRAVVTDLFRDLTSSPEQRDMLDKLLSYVCDGDVNAASDLADDCNKIWDAA